MCLAAGTSVAGSAGSTFRSARQQTSQNRSDASPRWMNTNFCVDSSRLMSTGMRWWQALVTILLGNTIVLAPILLNSHPGTKYGIPFPVFARAAYGTIGSNLPESHRFAK